MTESRFEAESRFAVGTFRDIPARRYNLSTGVGFKHPVIMRTVSFKAVSICLVCVDLPHTGHAYSATEKHRASAEILTVSG
ncbi:unnamed protein product [Macrosiphum euphorbiae]|uniref:Uncharacterized protein n=1 Tax=Macrosiphum euphorbiae TaxID=13131 RepID=A0AAV0YE71_9HEMI|nr:unnamed protein product [Macrosiphum euphorbiae]